MYRIVLVNAPISVNVPRAALPPLPLLVLARCLRAIREAGSEIDVKLLDFDLKLKKRELEDNDSFYTEATELTRQALPDAAFFTVHGSSLPIVLQLAENLKRVRPDVVVVLGGVAATLQARDLMAEFDAVDIIIKGAGEPAIPRLVGALTGDCALSDVPSCVYREGGSVRETEVSDAQELDGSFPSPDYELIDLDEYRAHNEEYPYVVPGFALVESGRGCRHNCSFCAPNAMWSGRVRWRHIEDVIDEMSFLASKRFNFSFLTQDNVDERFLVPFSERLIARGSQLPWGCYARLDRLNDETGELMARAGCRLIFAGIESPNPATFKLMNKRLNNENIVEKLTRFNALGIQFICSLIAGFPGESEADFEATLRLALHCSAGMTETQLEALLVDASQADLPERFVNFATVHVLSYMSGTRLYPSAKDSLRLTPYPLQNDAYESRLFGLDPFLKRHWQTLGGPFVTHLEEERARFYLAAIRLYELLNRSPYRFAALVRREGGEVIPFLRHMGERIGVDTVLTRGPATLEVSVQEDIRAQYGVHMRLKSRTQAE